MLIINNGNNLLILLFTNKNENRLSLPPPLTSQVSYQLVY